MIENCQVLTLTRYHHIAGQEDYGSPRVHLDLTDSGNPPVQSVLSGSSEVLISSLRKLTNISITMNYRVCTVVLLSAAWAEQYPRIDSY